MVELTTITWKKDVKLLQALNLNRNSHVEPRAHPTV